VAGEPETVGGQPSDIQPAVNNEIDAIASRLESCGYDICRVESGTLEELRLKLSDPLLRHRIVIVHYAGHSNANAILLRGKTGEVAELTPEVFNVQLADAPNIVLMFLNGCDSLPQLTRYNAMDIGRKDFAFLGNSAPVGSQVAADFAIFFYDELADGLTIFNAASRARGNLSQKHSERALETVVLKYGLQGKFTLADGPAAIHSSVYSDAKRVGVSSLFSKYLFCVVLIATLSAFAAHSEFLGLSSPAFQSAFSLKPNETFRFLIETNGMVSSKVDPDDLDLMNQIYGQKAPPDLTHLAKSCAPEATAADAPATIGIDQRVADHIERELQDVSARYGYLVEIARSILLAATLGLFFAYCSTEVGVPRGWPLLTRGEFGQFRRNFFGKSIIALVVLGSIFLIYYHAFIGPANLAKWEVGDRAWTERRWTLLHCFPEIWGNAWGTAEGKWEHFDRGGSAAFFRMYTLPYLFYLPYSFINFVGLLIPILYLVVMFVRASRFWLTNASESASIRLKALVVKGAEQQVEERRGELVARLTHVNRLGRRFVGSFAWLLLVLAIVEIFEAAVGIDTLATMARIWAIIAVVILAAASALFALLYIELTGQKNRIYDLSIVQEIPLPDDVRAAIDRLPAIFSVETIIVLALAIAGIAVSTAAILIGVT